MIKIATDDVARNQSELDRKSKAQRENPTNINMLINLEKFGFRTMSFVKTETSSGNDGLDRPRINHCFISLSHNNYYIQDLQDHAVSSNIYQLK